MTPTRESNPASALKVPTIDLLAEVQPDATVLEDNAVVGFAGRDLRARPFALLRSQIQRRLTRSHVRLVGVTSATPGAGKSFVSLNLAASLAKVSDAPVYLIDLDLRRGSIATALGLIPTAGIADVLAGRRTDVDGIGWRIKDANLAVFPTLAVEEGSPELLAGDAYANLIAGLRALPAETIVIFDLPPVFAGDDAMLSLELLDGYILVVETGRTTAKQVSHAMQMLEPTPCLGTILNKYRGGIADKYGYGYAYGNEPYRS